MTKPIYNPRQVRIPYSKDDVIRTTRPNLTKALRDFLNSMSRILKKHGTKCPDIS